MPMRKVTEFLSKISLFFKKDNANYVMLTIQDMIKGIKMTDGNSSFETKSKFNC